MTALGFISGLVLSLAVVFVGVLAGNGLDNPGISPPVLSAAGGASAPAPAPTLPAATGYSPFDGLDFNKDGRLSLAEAAGYGDIVVRFHRADRNKDGKLTKAEFDRLEKLPPPKARPKPKLQLRQDAAASLAAARSEGR